MRNQTKLIKNKNQINRLRDRRRWRLLLINKEDQETVVDKITDAIFKNVPYPYDPGIETDVAEDPNNS